MTEHQLNERIMVSRDVLHGKPHIIGTRIVVYQVLDLLAAGKTMDEIQSDDYFPDLRVDDIRAYIAYASQIIRDDSIIPSV